MARGSLVAVSYPVDAEFVQINTSVLDGLAEVAFLDGAPDAEFLDTLRQADVRIGWHLGQDTAGRSLAPRPVPADPALASRADSVDFAAIPAATLASNVAPATELHGAKSWAPPSGVPGQQSQDGFLCVVPGGEIAEVAVLAQLAERGGDRAAFLVLFDDARVDVGSPGHGRGIAQIVGYLPDDPGDSALAAGFTPGGGFRHGQAHGG